MQPILTLRALGAEFTQKGQVMITCIINIMYVATCIYIYIYIYTYMQLATKLGIVTICYASM